MSMQFKRIDYSWNINEIQVIEIDTAITRQFCSANRAQQVDFRKEIFALADRLRRKLDGVMHKRLQLVWAPETQECLLIYQSAPLAVKDKIFPNIFYSDWLKNRMVKKEGAE